MKAIFPLLILLSACCSYNDVKKEYSKGNKSAKILLEAGLNKKSYQVDEDFLEMALRGDEQALKIVLSQLKQPSNSSSVVPVPVVIPMRSK